MIPPKIRIEPKIWNGSICSRNISTEKKTADNGSRYPNTAMVCAGSELTWLPVTVNGAVTPLGLLNDVEKKVKLYLDTTFSDGLIGVHPNDNTATVWMKTLDLVRILEDHGTDIHIVEI